MVTIDKQGVVQHNYDCGGTWMVIGEGKTKLANINTEPIDMLEYVKIDPDVLSSVLVYAERYAMGRRTYAVADVCNAIKKYKRYINQRTRHAIIMDIKEGIGLYADGKLGANEDAKKWSDVLKELEEK